MDQQPEREALTKAGIATPPPLRIECPVFEGSLAALFHLAREGRVDLSGIPLAPVCAAYIEYLEQGGLEDMDAAGAALLALAYLVERKAWALLPIADPPPPQELPELPEPTVHEFADAVDDLAERHRERGRLFFRTAPGEAPEYELPIDLGDVTAGDLAQALESLLSRAEPLDIEPVARRWPSLVEVMGTVMRRLEAGGGSGGFDAMLPDSYTRLDAVFVFLAVLELLRLGKIAAERREGEVWFRLGKK
ncbi:MAG: hypothetical protein IH851_12535 [Armatimonadetes bacterium]|nr:hypothetical protein [Armatimonadota bacterium]